ncbi:hypothetical protein PORY_001679 [Pneumocystis oryctolagi]|uniref:Uncharacterized protein n=1 Tax=Pneumocystis oryctolagi TaxID=42067 RepID=A0ACB7CB93_9ASCO|nr:hypothetical protein PORY_001679 [Pneumocystis oryctolagi]
MSLNEISQKRKERLNELKKIKKSSDLKVNNAKDTSWNNEHSKINDNILNLSNLPLSFRNYDPELRGPRVGFENPLLQEYETVEHEAQKLKKDVDYQEKNAVFDYNELDISRLKPSKLNSDLKRLMDMKTERLREKTEIAISKLIRERLLMKNEVFRDDQK